MITATAQSGARAATAAVKADLSVSGLRLTYPSARGGLHQVLQIERFALSSASRVGISGGSGSGKSSFLHLLAGIERPSAGSIRWGDAEITAMSEGRRDQWRRRHVGLIFQNFHLLPGLSARDNVLLPLAFDYLSPPAPLVARANQLLAAFKLDHPDQPITTLSRGEQQRVAIARGLLREPEILLADEPTASLDARNGAVVGEMLVDAARASGASLVVVSHDHALLERLDIRYEMAGAHLSRIA